MTDKEFKQLSRAQLIDIIYQLQLQVDELKEKNHNLEKALKDKRLRINNAGNIAEAALEINNCFLSAQNAAEHYLNEIREIRKNFRADDHGLWYQEGGFLPGGGKGGSARFAAGSAGGSIRQ